VLAPFVLLRKQRPLPDGVLYSTFSAFVHKFLPHTFNDEDFTALQCEFRFFRMLLQYHDPQVNAWLDKNHMFPEL
jgi:hypothetical protein